MAVGPNRMIDGALDGGLAFLGLQFEHFHDAHGFAGRGLTASVLHTAPLGPSPDMSMIPAPITPTMSLLT